MPACHSYYHDFDQTVVATATDHNATVVDYAAHLWNSNNSYLKHINVNAKSLSPYEHVNCRSVL